MPYWNWADLYEEECMVNNIWLPDNKVNLTADQCKYCEPFNVERMKDVSHDFVSKIISENDGEPFVVTDTMTKWKKGVKELNVEEIVHVSEKQ